MKRQTIVLIGVIAGLAMLTGLVGWYVWYIQNTGVLNIASTDPKATISLISPPAGQKQVSTNGKASLRLSPNTYTVIARSGDKETRSTVEVQKQQTINDNLAFEPIHAKSLLIYADAQGLQGQGGTVNYINVPQSSLYQYSSSRSDPVPYAPSTALQLAQVQGAVWQNLNHGLVHNSFGDYFVLQDQQSTQLVAQSRANQNSPTPTVHDAAINSANHIASSIGGGVFFQPDPNADLQKVADLGDGVASVNISDSDLLAYYLQSGPEVYKNGDFRLHIVGPANKTTPEKVIENKEPVKATRWSPDSQKLLFGTAAGLYVYDLTNQHKLTILPSNSSLATFIAWKSNTELVYVDNQTIWLYSTDTQIAHKLTSFTEQSALFQGLSVSDNRDSLFYSIKPSNDQGVPGGIFIVPLR